MKLSRIGHPMRDFRVFAVVYILQVKLLLEEKLAAKPTDEVAAVRRKYTPFHYYLLLIA